MKQTLYKTLANGIALLLGLLCAALPSSGQYENVWVFGRKNAGIDFNSATPQPFASHISLGVNTFGEGNASVCNTNGNLLFYTDGTRVLDRQHNLMPNGNNLVPTPFNALTAFTPTSSTAQGALIVPVPGSSTRYYIFSLTSFESDTINHFCKLYYSIVDMSLNNGFGDVVTGQKALAFDSVLTERMTAVPGTCKNIWLLTVAQNMTVKAYEINASGINPVPVLSPIATLANLSSFNTPAIAGAIVASPDHSKIAITREEQTPTSLAYAGLALFDFDRANGTLSNERQLNPAGAGYGVCFSPDNTKLYFGQYGAGIHQFNLSAGTLAAIIGSKTYVMPGSGHLKLAPNGRIYCQGSMFDLGLFAATSLSAINQPNQAGLACMPMVNALTLFPGTGMSIGLPNVIAVTTSDTLFSSRKVSECGVALRLAATDTTGTGYVWNDGTTGDQRQINAPGKYWVYYKGGCSNIRVDSFLYRFRAPVVVLPPDTVVCDQRFPLTVKPKEAGNYRWEDNSTIPERNIYAPGTYWVTFEAEGCTQYDTLTVGSEHCPCNISVPNAFSPNNDGLNDYFKPTIALGCVPAQYSLRIFNRWGQLVYKSNNEFDQGWDGTYNGVPADMGSYFYELRFKTDARQEGYYKKGEVVLIR